MEILKNLQELNELWELIRFKKQELENKNKRSEKMVEKIEEEITKYNFKIRYIKSFNLWEFIYYDQQNQSELEFELFSTHNLTKLINFLKNISIEQVFDYWDKENNYAKNGVDIFPRQVIKLAKNIEQFILDRDKTDD